MVQSTKKNYFSSCSRNFVAVCLLIILTWSAFSNILQNDFIDFDDTEYIVDNPYVRMGLTLESIRWAFTTVFLGNWHPLTLLSHMADVELFGLHPAGHHLTSLLLHLLTAIALFEWLRRATGSLWCAFAAALFFSIHPLRAESVAWAAERKDVLCGFFGVLTLAAYCAFTKKKTFSSYGLTFLLLSLGLLAKGMLVTWPLVFLLLDVWPLERMKTIKDLKPLLLEKIPFFLLCIGFCFVLYFAQKQGGAQTDWTVYPLRYRLENAAVSYFRYLSKIFYPTNLSVLYPLRPDFSLIRLGFSLGALLGISVFFGLQSRRRPWLFVGWFWYLIVLLPVIGLVQIGRQAMADRYTYLPSIGAGIALFWAVREWTRARPGRIVSAGVLCAAGFAALLFGTWIQTYRWKDTITLFEHSIQVTGDNPTLEVNLAYRLAQTGQLDRAIEMSESVLERYPNLFQCAVNLGSFHLKKNNYEKALFYLQKALAIRPKNHSEILGYIAEVYLRSRQIEAAEKTLLEALQDSPRNARLLNALGEVRCLQGRTAEAVNAWRQSLEQNPYFSPAEENLAWVLAVCEEDAVRRPQEALSLSRHLVRLFGPTARRLDILAAAYAAVGDFPQAATTAQEAWNLAYQNKNTTLLSEIETRLQLYQQGKSFLEKVCGQEVE